MNSLKNEKGQSIVEFAIILPLLLLLIMGIIEFGFILNSYLTIQNASREGARIGIVGSSDTDIKNLVISDSPNLQSSNLTVQITPADGDRHSGETIIVNVSYNYEAITPIIGSLFSNILVLDAQTSMRIE